MPTIYALCIGINDYPTAPLSGCVNDALSFSGYLDNIAGFLVKKRLLLDQQATKSAIVAGFREHLAQAGPEDTALVYFAGHGCQEIADPIWTTESDRRLESLVCHQSEAAFLLADKELRFLIHELANSGTSPHILTIFDCCHSGDNTRATFRARRIANAFPQRDRADFIFSEALSKKDFQLPEALHISLSACASDEQALEKNNQGLFTQSLLEALKQSNKPLSYQELIRQIRARLKAYSQQPALYIPAGNRADLQLADAIFPGKIIPPSNTDALSISDKQHQALPGQASGVDFIKIFIDTETQNAAMEATIQETLFIKNPALQRVLVEQNADYVLNFKHAQWFITRPGTPQFPLVQPTQSLPQVHSDLLHIAAWERLRQYKNEDQECPLTIEFFQEPEHRPLIANAEKEIPLACFRTLQGEWGTAFSAKITNNGTEKIYFCCLLLNRAFGAQPELLRPALRMASPGESIQLLDYLGGTIEVQIDEVALQYGWPEYREHLLFIASSTPFPVEDLALPNLPDPLMQAGGRSTTRDMGFEHPMEFQHHWSTRLISFLMHRSPA